jgi:hypothetical protein
MRVIVRWKPLRVKTRVIIRWKPLQPGTRWTLASSGVGLCVAALAVREFTAPRVASVAEKPPFAVSLPQTDLVVSEAGFAGNPQSRRLVGILRNTSNRTYTDVKMTFSFLDPKGDSAGSAVATVNRIGAHASATFETADATSDTGEIVLKQIEAMPPAGAP